MNEDSNISSASATLPYATPGPHPEKSFYHHAARASWWAPLIAVLVWMLVMATQSQSSYSPVIVAIANVGIVLLGLCFGIIALCGMRGRKGILAQAIVGIVLNLLLLTFAVSVYSAVQVKLATARAVTAASAASAPQSPAAQVQKLSREALEKFPGWLGVNKRGDVTIAVAEWNDSAPGTANLKSSYTADFKCLTVTIDNRNGDSPMTFDPASVEVHFADYHTLHALPPEQILGTATADREKFIERWGKPRTVAAQTQMVDGLAFLPAGTDLTSAKAVKLSIDGQTIVVQGKFLSAEQKDALFARIHAAQKAPDGEDQ